MHPRHMLTHSWLRETMAGQSLVFEEPCGGEGASVGKRGASMVETIQKGLGMLSFYDGESSLPGCPWILRSRSRPPMLLFLDPLIQTPSSTTLLTSNAQRR